MNINNKMGYESIPKLLLSMAIPAIIANIVNALYNIIDQIFIGQGVGYLGNAATSISFPLTTISLAIGLMIGVGGASNFNIELGKGNRKKAEEIVGSAIGTLIITGIVLCIMIIIFLKPLMILFGATNEILEYAMKYSAITSLGLPFFLIAVGINPLVRADGSSKYSMFAIILGALTNTILDPIFIFIFNMGIEGAAIATVISQIISALTLLFYFKNSKNINLIIKDILPKPILVKQILSFGMSSFIFQSSNMLIQIITNNLLKYYGETSIYGSNIPIAVSGIVMKINIIFIAVIIGLVQGTQPILGYNYGAKKYERVIETSKFLFILASILSTLCFLIFQIFPRQIVSLFGSGDKLYFDFAIKYIHIYMAFTFLNGVQTCGSTFFPAIGKAFKGALIAFTKQILFLLPLLIILPNILNLDGIIYATPICDLMSFILVIILIYTEFKSILSKA